MIAPGQCEIHEVTELTGEASASNRKAKLIFFYEWDVKLEWKGDTSLWFLFDASALEGCRRHYVFRLSIHQYTPDLKFNK